METNHRINVKEILRQFSDARPSTHYQKPIDAGSIVDLQPDFEVKTITDKDSFDKIYNLGAMDKVNEIDMFMFACFTGSSSQETLRIQKAFGEWVEEQRKTLKP